MSNTGHEGLNRAIVSVYAVSLTIAGISFVCKLFKMFFLFFNTQICVQKNFRKKIRKIIYLNKRGDDTPLFEEREKFLFQGRRMIARGKLHDLDLFYLI